MASTPLDCRRDQQATLWSPEGHHGVQRWVRSGRSEADRRNSGYHESPAEHSGETDWSQHLTGDRAHVRD